MSKGTVVVAIERAAEKRTEQERCPLPDADK